MKKPASYYIGNVLILFSLLGFVLLGYPLFSAYALPSPTPKVFDDSYTLLIPKIHASGDIIENVDPWNQAEYKEALKKGIAQAKGFSNPGEKGTIFMFAHSSGMPWELTRNNTVFLRLGELEKGDEIVIRKKGVTYTYHVVEKREVYPHEVSIVTQNMKEKDQLILQTCTPIGTDWKRLLVFAKEIKE